MAFTFSRIFLAVAMMSLFLTWNARGQSAPASLPTPDWVTMMEDPNVNYFKAVSAYKSYWQTHPKPPGEEEEMQQGNTRVKGESPDSEKEREEKERESKKKKWKGSQLEQVEYLKYQSKRFEDWAREAKPWVQENGHILTQEERAEIARKQQEEIQQQNKK